ncbi:hypothetical protein DITRI_Ditri10aG0002000 [Diplodiscus trichospermus]
MEMAQEIQDRTTVIRGAPVVEPNNKYFWFNRPQWILFLIHYTLFQNAFQMAYFLWVVFKYTLNSCFHEKLYFVIGRVILGVGLQILCSYITFPLYALVTQMGSHMKRSIFEEQTAKALKNWHKAAKRRNKKKKEANGHLSVSGETTPSRGTSPLHLLHKHKQRELQEDSVPNSPISNYYNYPSDTDLSDIEGSSIHPAPPQDQGKPTDHNIDFSFVKPN